MKVKTETVREIYVIRNKMHKVAIKPKYVQNTFSLLTEKQNKTVIPSSNSKYIYAFR